MNTPKRVHLLLCWQLLLAQMSMAQSTGFVSLEGRQFMLDGQEFYPMAMNYSVLLARDANNNAPLAADIYFAPDASFGPTPDFDCGGDCPDRLRTDFQKIRSMGFNTVRVVGGFCATYRDTPEHGTGERRFSINLHRNPILNGDDHDAERMWVDLEEGISGPYATAFFNQVNLMLDVAADADLKVILLVGGSSRKESNRDHMYPTFDQTAVEDYAVYLGALAEAVKDHPALLAYDLFNEPQFNTLEYQEADDEEHPQGHDKWKKQDICDFTAAWYGRINEHDPNHLITLGGLGDYELEVWDPAVLHIDFYSLHIYPWKDYLGQWDPAQSMEYFQAKLHWFGQTCPMPWIIGETGWSANDDVIPPHTGPYPTYHEWPFTQGLEADQATFTAWCMDLTRQCGGSGWSWWYFQEFRWWDFYYDINHPDGPAYEQVNLDNGESLMLGIYYAMLKPGDGNADYYEKPAVDEVRNFILDPMPDPPGAEPANYYNWDNLAGSVAYSGTIVDQSNEPIKDAQAWFRWEHPDDLGTQPNIGPDDEFLTFHPSVTNSTGLFECYKPPLVTGFYDPVYFNIILAGVGTSVEAHGGWFDGIQPLNGSTFLLDRNAFNFDSRVENLTVPSTTGVDNLNYEAWDELEVEDVTVSDAPDPGATQVEFAARQAVHVLGEFHAQEGSETHLLLRETFPNCDEDSYKYLSSGASDPSYGVASKSRIQQLRLRFTLTQATVRRVSPNPFTNRIEVNWGAEGVAQLELLDATGRVVLKWKRSGTSARLEPGSLAPGPYYLRINANGLVTTHQIIKQP